MARMEIKPLHQVQSQQVPKEAQLQPNLAAGEYFVLKEKSKTEILSISENALLNSIDKANKAVQGTPHEFKYRLHQTTGDVIVQILNKETHEIIHEIPSEKFIELVEKLQELSVGAIIDEKR